MKDLLIDTLQKEREDLNEIRLVFDRYIANPLKEHTREKRTSGNAVRYIVHDSTNIAGRYIVHDSPNIAGRYIVHDSTNKAGRYIVHDSTNKAGISLNQFLSPIGTKKDLSNHVIETLHKRNKTFVVVYDTKQYYRLSVLLDHNQEEADTLIIVQGLHVAENNQFRELCIVSSDTDVFILLLHFFLKLCTTTIFRRCAGKDFKDIDGVQSYEALGANHAEAILGFNVFMGCDQIGRFNGKSKLDCWKIFI